MKEFSLVLAGNTQEKVDNATMVNSLPFKHQPPQDFQTLTQSLGVQYAPYWSNKNWPSHMLSPLPPSYSFLLTIL